ncbi:hypothetical protein N1031_03405 [Herbiconiux moechotypicola]|uniref:RelA/SpoT domain-containing protein n=1 Tax=Herbiconiux moechotypicola TaxID=637393 RepID=A0ABP5Q601_9MICO|nr:hypothetical protein [Herbiconiux moechotypicola]MCS5728796.1 hypothetical protein [Herbiconiux moechotypicola]
MTRPWSDSQLRRLGTCLKHDREVPATLPNYVDVMLWYNELAASVQKSIRDLDWSSLLDTRTPNITSRGKTRDTLVQKLRREESIPLHRVQDIAGVRFEADMTLDEQMAVAVAIAGVFGLRPESEYIHDLRDAHHSGYRAVHVWIQTTGRVEVQVRTTLQGEWANMYERAADVLGRGIRYGQVPREEPARTLVEQLQELSYDRVRSIERQRNEIHLLELNIAQKQKTPRAEAFFRSGSDEEAGGSLESLRATVLQMQHELRTQINAMERAFAGMRHEGEG